MPKRTDIKSILIIGAGPIIIGQACEFDYSGTQACKALKEEGYRIILVNSNPATIMTDPEIADATYIEPIHWKIIKKIIKKEKPDAILPTMGGQTAINCTLKLYEKNILSDFNIQIIGANIEAIKKSEDRNLFQQSMKKIGLKTANCKIVNNIKDALCTVKKIGFPCIIRPSFTMGGTGGGIAYNKKEFTKMCKKGLNLSPIKELLIDESLIGWKEYEMEVVRDCNNNCIIVCSIENFDPMGIHTGDSITVAPSQTLTDKEYQMMRNASIKILAEIGVETGGSNVQFAINPKNGKMVVIEMNPRVSRSSALASKATGFPIAKVAAKLAIGYTLDELKNDITNGKIPIAFEPTIDYVVTKIPKFNFEKFTQCNDRLTTQMKSVGEVMAIGKTFQESLHKAIIGLETQSHGFNNIINTYHIDTLKKIKYELKNPGSNRLWYIADAFRSGLSIPEIYQLTFIDKWFLKQILHLITTENNIKNKKIYDLNYKYLKNIKSKGFSDFRISQLMNVSEEEIRTVRYNICLHPVFKRIDSCSAEFNTNTAYMYSTWEKKCEANPTINKKKIIILGSGPNRIGQGIEFDYCCVHAAQSLQNENYETIMINSNPETVSTDYDISSRLYFEPIHLENILEIYRKEKPQGIIIQFGGQTPLKLSKQFKKFNIPIIGTNYQSINKTEDRNEFQKIVQKIKLKQPKNYTIHNVKEGIIYAEIIKYPIIVRPSYVLGGRFMQIVYNQKQLIQYFHTILTPSKKIPILLDQYLENATEIDVDIICDGEKVFFGGIMEHIEQAGIHSGDSACTLPPYTLSNKIQNKIEKQMIQLTLELSILGLLNVQLAIKNNKIYIIEANPRASRTIPFISKSTGIPISKIAAKVITGKTLAQQGYDTKINLSHYFVKESILPFNKFPGIDPILGPEMRSTGEVMGIGKTFYQAFAKAMLHSQKNIKNKKYALLSINNINYQHIINISCILIQLGFRIDITKKINTFLKIYNKDNDTHTNTKNATNIQKNIKNKKYSYIIDTTMPNSTIKNTKLIRRLALENKIHYNTTIRASFATIMSITIDPYNNPIKLQSLYKI